MKATIWLREEHALAQADDAEETKPEPHARPAPLLRLVRAARRPSDWPMRVAVAVPNAMHAVNVSLSVSMMSVFAALLTASTPPQRPTHAPLPTAAPASSCPAVRAKRPKPTIMTTVAAAAGTESLRMTPVSVRERLHQAERAGTRRARAAA